MAVYVNGVMVNECEGVYVNGTPVQNVYVNGQSAYTSRCGQYVFWSNNSIAAQTPVVDCGGGGVAYTPGGFEVSSNGLRRAQYGNDGNDYGEWIWSQNQGLGVGNSVIAGLNFYGLNHNTFTAYNNEGNTCGGTSVYYDWNNNTFSGATRSSDTNFIGPVTFGDYINPSGNTIRAEHWEGCADCTPTVTTYGDWCAATQG